MQNLVVIGAGVSAPQIRDFAVPLGWLVSSFFVGRVFFNKATAYIPERMFTQDTSNNVVPGKEVLLRSPDILKFPKNRHFGDRFWLALYFSVRKSL